MAFSATVTPLGLMHMTVASLASYPSPEMGMAPRAVYAPFACHNWPTISYSGASTDSSLCIPLTSRANSIVWPILFHDKFCFEASGGSTLSEPHCTDSVQSHGGQGTNSSGTPILAQQNLVLARAPIINSFLVHSAEEGPPFSGKGHNLAPMHRPLEPPPPWTRPRGLQRSSTCGGKDPQRCGIESVLFFHQGGMDSCLSASTLKVQVAAISAMTWWKANRWGSPIWSLDSSETLQQDPFEPLQSVDLTALSVKTDLLTALTSVKRVGDLQALFVNDLCLEFGLPDSHVVLRPQPEYVPKVPTTALRDQVATLQAILSHKDNPNLSQLHPVHALCIYIEHTQSFRHSEQLFVCFGGQQKGKAVSKQTVFHWIVDTIHMVYQARDLTCPLRVTAHSIRGVTASAALTNGASLTDICRAAGWATPNTFTRLYNLQMELMYPRVLNASFLTQETGMV
ncbi:60S ribosomal protein L15-A [Labeo rohita]|uniref:60S ribosomal protein L15-A n=1 Tax=Labeo rohita TaxID=84645 RepID=A0ABQ8MEH6_LABRO|nr:60S ribosomal protein L15-A [Labeo rohita]